MDEDGHDRYDKHGEQHRTTVICSFNHRFLRATLGRKATDDKLDVSSQQIVNQIRIMARDTQCEFSSVKSEDDYNRDLRQEQH